jgi:hypothetical protein
MNSRAIAFAVATALFIAEGCKRSGGSLAVSPAPSKPAVATSSAAANPIEGQLSPATPSALNDEIRNRGSLTFRSWNGKWIGMDADTDLTFLPDGVIHMVEYGIGVSHTAGRTRRLTAVISPFSFPRSAARGHR